ncbi:MAG: hypothetical protein K2W95_26040 [Candidatus Obscuribacterales bacterium]|nr:hypothetical protein [Candidatus Obscuribacterales bacterium]
MKTIRISTQGLLGLLVAVVLSGCSKTEHDQPLTDADLNNPNKVLGRPLPGLTAEELRKFRVGEMLFKKEFTPEEGLGPMFNGKSCWECHGQPGPPGGEGRDISSTSILNYAKRDPVSPKSKKPLKEVIRGLTKVDVDFFLTKGGPSLQRKTITTEFPNRGTFQDQLDFEQVPMDAELQSNRHSPPIYGDGLIDSIPDGEFTAQGIKEMVSDPAVAGRAAVAVDRYTEASRSARFGWKDQHVNLFNFTTGAMNIELGLTTYGAHTENSSEPLGDNPEFLRKINQAGQPNDKGKILLALTWYQTLLAPPPRGPITPQVTAGEKVFEKLDCAFCHRPSWTSASKVMVADPDSKLPLIDAVEVAALENKTFYPYSDFLLHDMGLELADGIPQEGAKGGEWRTTPLWGLRFKKFLMHDGRTRDIHTAILMHGGQAQSSADRYKSSSQEDKDALLAFLKSL